MSTEQRVAAFNLTWTSSCQMIRFAIYYLLPTIVLQLRRSFLKVTKTQFPWSRYCNVVYAYWIAFIESIQALCLVDALLVNIITNSIIFEFLTCCDSQIAHQLLRARYFLLSLLRFLLFRLVLCLKMWYILVVLVISLFAHFAITGPFTTRRIFPGGFLIFYF